MQPAMQLGRGCGVGQRRPHSVATASNGRLRSRPARLQGLTVKAVAEPKLKEKAKAPEKGPVAIREDAALSELELRKLTQQVDTDVAPQQQRPPAPVKTPVEAPAKAPEIQWPPKRPFAAIALDNALDSATDIMRHLQRASVPLPTVGAFERLVQRGGGKPAKLAPTKKPVVLVLGSGWGAHSLTKVIDHETFDVVVVSPRNHFVFTPMLPSTAVGTVEFRSLLEPVRTSNPFVTYFEATCDTIDLASKTALCTSPSTRDDGRQPQFEVQFDKLVVAVGEQPASFGVPGVREHCFFMKEVTDCVELRLRIGRLFELSNLPGTSDEERKKNLHFVVVGGGPTGVEFAGTLADFVREDLKKKYPQLMKYVKVTLLQSAQSILTTFQERLQQRALDNLRGQGVEVRLGVRVVEVTESQVVLKDGDRLDYGAVVWSAGNSARQLVKDLVAALPEQAQYQRGPTPVTNKLAVDPFLRVIGARDVFAIGDCAALVGNRLPTTAQVAAQQGSYLAHLINRNYEDGGVGGMYNTPPSRPISAAGPSLPALPPSLAPLRSFLMGGKAREEIGGEVAEKLAAMEEPPWAEAARAARVAAGKPASSASASTSGDGDGNGKVMVAANGLGASSVGQVGERHKHEALEFHTRPFEFLSLGIMAYVGNDKALTQLEAFDIRVPLYGSFAFLLWRSVYITKQVSFRNRVLILFDWVKTQVFGRDLSLF